MVTLIAHIFFAVLAHAQTSDLKKVQLIQTDKGVVAVEVPPDAEERDCYFGATTSASKLEKIKYDLIKNAKKYDFDPNLLYP